MLGLNVIADGIETRAQADSFKSLKCDDAQGCFYSRPLFPADFVSLLKSAEWQRTFLPIQPQFRNLSAIRAFVLFLREFQYLELTAAE